jgi:hypothetical protein
MGSFLDQHDARQPLHFLDETADFLQLLTPCLDALHHMREEYMADMRGIPPTLKPKRLGTSSQRLFHSIVREVIFRSASRRCLRTHQGLLDHFNRNFHNLKKIEKFISNITSL